MNGIGKRGGAQGEVKKLILCQGEEPPKYFPTKSFALGVSHIGYPVHT